MLKYFKYLLCFVFLLSQFSFAEKALVRLTLYKPLYWIQGINDSYKMADTKLGLGFKYQVIEDMNLYFAYSEYFFWDREVKSLPFRDINHNPEIFYRQDIQQRWLEYIDWGIYEHMSNGQAGDYSRSIDRRYLRFKTTLVEKEPLFNVAEIAATQNISTVLKIFKYIDGSLGDNQDYDKYVTSFSLRLEAKQWLNFLALSDTEFYIEVIPGRHNKGLDFNKGSVEMGYIFNFEFFGLNPRFYLQSYNGYGESMLEYNYLQHAIRLGLMIF